MNSAWLCYMGHLAGLSRWETMNLPMGQLNDQIACYQIMHGMAKELKAGKEKSTEKKTVHERFWDS